MLRVGARAGALRRRGPPGQGPRARGDAALQESHRTGQPQPFITHLFSRGFRGFSLADPSVYVYSWLSNSGYSTCIIWRMNKKPYLEDDKEIKVGQ